MLRHNRTPPWDPVGHDKGNGACESQQPIKERSSCYVTTALHNEVFAGTAWRSAPLMAGMLGVAAHAAFAVDHPADGPQVNMSLAVASDVLMLTIQSGFHVQAQSMPYVAEPGDVVIEDGKDNPKSKAYEHPFIQDGKLTNRFDLVLQCNGTQDRATLP